MYNLNHRKKADEEGKSDEEQKGMLYATGEGMKYDGENYFYFIVSSKDCH